MSLDSNCLGRPCAAFAGDTDRCAALTARTPRAAARPGATLAAVRRRTADTWRRASEAAAALALPAQLHRLAARPLAALRAALLDRQQRRIARAELSAMDERLLADIGLTRDSLAAAPPRPVWYV